MGNNEDSQSWEEKITVGSAEVLEAIKKLIKEANVRKITVKSPSGKKIVTQMDGGFYRDYLTLSPEQKARVNKLLALWSAWAGKAAEAKVDLANTPVASAVSPESADLPPIQPVLDWSVQEALKAEETEALSILPAEDRPKTIAGQISLIIEKMLVTSPIKEKGIKLIENEHQGVDVWIGLEKFDGIAFGKLSLCNSGRNNFFGY